ncbi:tetratricopeptide repeat protein 17-like [Acropora palmata]|uniref:tetratricopeptide repeat protein 17-like n=1 Tax=Acropora palmata TaxID=6131 RepID=UPI003DA01D37
MCSSYLTLYALSLAVLYSLSFCKGATHWIVTEDGRIQQQADSIFDLKSPDDLVTFIHQEDALERLKVLRDEYLMEKRKVIEARGKERDEQQKSFYKTDPDCLDAGQHISEFELHLDMTFTFAEKGINIPDHVNLCEPLPSHVEPPHCLAELPSIMYSYDHLDGVSSRQQLNTSTETNLLTPLSSYFKTAYDLGSRVSLALETNSSSWVLLNLAAYYWRIKGNAQEAVECLRRALYFSPREHQDRALMSLAAVLHHSKHSLDSVVLLHSAMGISNEQSVYHFLLGNIYSSLKMYEMADLCYRFTLVFSPKTETLCERVKTVRCELKLEEFLKKKELDFYEQLDRLKTPELDETLDPSREEREKKPSLPQDLYKRQLNRMFSIYTKGRIINWDTCKTRDPAAKQAMELFSDGSGEDRQQASQLRKVENEKLSIAKQTSIDQITDHIESTSEEKDAFTLHSQSRQNSEALNEGESMNLIAKEGKANTERRIKKAAPDNKNISVEAKATQNLEEARLALNRLEDVVQTVSQNRKTAASTAKSDTVASSVKGTQSAGDKESRVTNRKARRSRRGETGQKLSSNDADGKEDSAKAVITEEIKIPRPKGEPMYMSKNGPSVLSKNTREIPSADEMFEDRKEDKPFGPKHTPPLESKHVFSRTNNCASMGGKKRKGEVFALNCLPQVPSTEGEEVTKQAEVSTSEFSEAEIKQETKGEINLPLQSDSETMSVVKTSFDEMSATGSSHSSPTNDSLEAEAAEKQGMNNTDAKVLMSSDERTKDRNVGSKLKSKLAEQSEMMTDIKNGCVADSKLSDCQTTKRQHTVASAKKLSAKEAEKAEDKTPPLETEPIGKQSEDVARLSRGSSRASKRSVENKQTKSHVKVSSSASLEGDYNNEDKRKVKPSVATLKSQQKSPELKTSRATTSQKLKDGTVKEVDYIHKVGAGSSVFETSFLNVPTSGSLQELGDEECKHIEGVQALVVRNRYFSAWLSLDTKNIDVRAHIDFSSEVDDSVKEPRCTAKIKSNLHTFNSLQGVLNAAKLEQVSEAGLTETLLTIGRTLQDSVDEMGARIYNALKRNSTSWVLLNVASLYWRVQGDTAEAIKCLRQALHFSPSHTRDVAHIGLASILLREGHLEDTAVVIKKALEISPRLALGHFILGNVFGAQSNIPDAIQHYLLALQLEPGFTPAVERLKIIQCVLWKQQKALEKEAADLRKLLTRKQV